MVAIEDFEYVGSVEIESGQILIGDPILLLPHDEYGYSDASYADVEDYYETYQTFRADPPFEPFGKGQGLIAEAGLGDGTYDVYAKYVDEGAWGRRIGSLLIDFRPTLPEEFDLYDDESGDVVE